MQLSLRVMMGNGLTWAVVLTILTDPQRTGGKIYYRVKKFNVPAHIVRLLGNLPLVTGSGIRGNVLVIEDTFSLLTGRPMKLQDSLSWGP